MPAVADTRASFEELINRFILEQNTTAQFEKFTLEKAKESDLFSGVLDCAEDCILVSAFIETNEVISKDGTETSKLGEECAVVGSPLKLHDYLADLHLSQTPPSSSSSNVASASRQSVCLNDARRLVSLYNLAYQQCRRRAQKDGIMWPHLWVLCDGKDRRHAAYLSASIRSAAKQSCMQLSFVGDKYCNGSLHPDDDVDAEGDQYIAAGYVITTKGPLTEHCKPPTVESLIDEEILKKPHRVAYVAQYELMSRTSDDAVDSIVNRHGSIDAAVQWSRHSTLLQEPPLDVIATLAISPVSGNPRSPVRTLYNDLSTLQGFVGGLNNGLVQWSVVDSDFALLDRVKSLVEDQKVARDVKKENVQRTSDSDDMNLPLKFLQLIDRQDLDFTEQLWDILRDCSSYSDLVTCLQYVIDCLHAQTLQPMVHKQNSTKLGELIRDSYKGRCDPLLLKRVSALTVLVEVGVDKLFRDYVHAFLVKDLVTMNHLSKLVTDSGKLTIEDRVGRLIKLHHVLEMTVMLEQCLNLPHHLLCSAARMALEYYEDSDVGASDVFTLSVPSAAISEHLNNYRPRLWKVDYIAPSDCGDLHANVTLSLAPTFPHVSPAATSLAGSPADQKKFAGYYVTIANEFADFV